jgi:hypothetical protein
LLYARIERRSQERHRQRSLRGDHQLSAGQAKRRHTGARVLLDDGDEIEARRTQGWKRAEQQP